MHKGDIITISESLLYSSVSKLQCTNNTHVTETFPLV